MRLRHLLSAAILLLFLTSPAQAATIDLVLTVEVYVPPLGQPPELGFNYRFFQSASNGWPDSTLQPQTGLAGGSATLLPGVTQYYVSLDAVSLDDVYFAAFGQYTSFAPGAPPPPFGFPSYYVAEPPDGNIDGSDALGYGPPWIPLVNLGDGFSDNFTLINGYLSRGGIGTWTITPAPAAVPEPASLLLLGSGLAAIASRKYRQSKAGTLK